jgi:hypothetical protein
MSRRRNANDNHHVDHDDDDDDDDDESEYVVAQGSALLMAPETYISVNPGLFDAPPPMLLNEVDDAALLALASRDHSVADTSASALRKRGRPRKSGVVETQVPKPRKPATTVAPKPVKPKSRTKESRRVSSGGNAVATAGAAAGAGAAVEAPVVDERELSLADELDEIPTDLILRENALLIEAIKELQGVDVDKAVQLQQQLQFNLVYLLSCDHHVPPLPPSTSSATASTRHAD